MATTLEIKVVSPNPVPQAATTAGEKRKRAPKKSVAQTSARSNSMITLADGGESPLV